ncbi:MAG: diguanylate cyclase, partial [Lachnospiraceae bacterium]
LMKGEQVVNGQFQYLDSVKEDTGIDISIFYSDTRFLTTVQDNGKRITGTKAHAVIISDILKGGNDKFYSNTRVGDVNYFMYYRPIYDSKGQIIGMLEVGKPADEVYNSIGMLMLNVGIVCGVLIILAAVIAVVFAGRLTRPLGEIESFAEKVKEGKLDALLDEDVLKREDEIGRMGNSILEMQKSIRVLVEEDELTHLNNRRFGEKRLKSIKKAAPNTGVDYALAMGDIDFFKKVNDNYGHDCGDMVLQNVARILKSSMNGKGFVIRWGGEEFLLAFEGINAETAAMHLENILDEIRKSVVVYNDIQVKVTMTFGVVEGNGTTNLDEMFKAADKLLYEGKQQGRNCIVTGGFIGENR